MTADVPGDVVEYGSLHGVGRSWEALNTTASALSSDSFDSIPASRFRLDYRWNSAFSNNSYQEVKLRLLTWTRQGCSWQYHDL